MNKKGIILLSSGLDSFVSLYLAKEVCDIILAINFNYGQKAAYDEANAAKKIAEINNIEFKIIDLPFLKELTDNALTNENKKLEFDTLGVESMKAVWVPNRNGLFFNIAGAYADSMGADYIIYGGNIEEAETFSDNTPEFNNIANEFFKYSTLKHPKILAPCFKMTKVEIINEGIKRNLDFSLIKSCYNSNQIINKTHCGKCESCIRLKNAILKSKNKDLINLIF